MAARVVAASIMDRAATHERSLMSHLAQRMNAVLYELAERIRRKEDIDKSDVAECVERKFGVTFASNYKHPIIKSMLQLYINCSDATRVSDARNCLNVLYEDTGQDKATAVSYIEESRSTLNPYIYY